MFSLNMGTMIYLKEFKKLTTSYNNIVHSVYSQHTEQSYVNKVWIENCLVLTWQHKTFAIQTILVNSCITSMQKSFMQLSSIYAIISTILVLNCRNWFVRLYAIHQFYAIIQWYGLCTTTNHSTSETLYDDFMIQEECIMFHHNDIPSQDYWKGTSTWTWTNTFCTLSFLHNGKSTHSKFGLSHRTLLSSIFWSCN